MSNVTKIHESDIRARLAELRTQDPTLTQAEIARQSGIGQTRLSQWMKGTYTGDNDKLEADLERWINAYIQREMAERALPSAPAWVATPTAERILGALGYAQTASDIVVIYGGAGLGKTCACRHYQATSPNVWHAVMSPAAASVVPALEEVAEAVGIKPAGGAARIHRSIVQRLRGSYGLLIIDEAQHLNTQALDQMRSIHDATEIGVALVGNQQVYATMTGGNRAAYLDRLYSRIGKRLHLKQAATADIEAIVGAWDVRLADCKQLLTQIASRPGGLRTLTKVLRLATTYATARKSKLGCEDIRAALHNLEGDS